MFPADRGQVHPEPPDAENALTAMGAKTKVLRNGSDQGERAIAICWIEHLIGDLHQPLHTCSLYNIANPKGDRGGNSDIVRVEDGRAEINLHSLWDGLMTSSEKYATSAKIAEELLSRPEFARDKLPGVDDPKPVDWAWESYTAAVHTAYLDGKLKMGAKDSEAHNAPILPDGYPQAAKIVAEQRIASAGYRLADQLVNDMTPGGATGESTPTDSPPPAQRSKATGTVEHIGPKGGHYHFDANGKKVYDKK